MRFFPNTQLLPIGLVLDGLSKPIWFRKLLILPVCFVRAIPLRWRWRLRTRLSLWRGRRWPKRRWVGCSRQWPRWWKRQWHSQRWPLEAESTFLLFTARSKKIEDAADNVNYSEDDAENAKMFRLENFAGVLLASCNEDSCDCSGPLSASFNEGSSDGDAHRSTEGQANPGNHSDVDGETANLLARNILRFFNDLIFHQWPN